MSKQLLPLGFMQVDDEVMREHFPTSMSEGQPQEDCLRFTDMAYTEAKAQDKKEFFLSKEERIFLRKNKKDMKVSLC